MEFTFVSFVRITKNCYCREWFGDGADITFFHFTSTAFWTRRWLATNAALQWNPLAFSAISSVKFAQTPRTYVWSGPFWILHSIQIDLISLTMFFPYLNDLFKQNAGKTENKIKVCAYMLSIFLIWIHLPDSSTLMSFRCTFLYVRFNNFFFVCLTFNFAVRINYWNCVKFQKQWKINLARERINYNIFNFICMLLAFQGILNLCYEASTNKFKKEFFHCVAAKSTGGKRNVEHVNAFESHEMMKCHGKWWNVRDFMTHAWQPRCVV